jgi:hypothetical protein
MLQDDDRGLSRWLSNTPEARRCVREVVAGKPRNMNDVNEYGVPLHACNGYRFDEHYWAWLAAIRLGLTRKL